MFLEALEALRVCSVFCVNVNYSAVFLWFYVAFYGIRASLTFSANSSFTVA